jgi:hypothetical protein
MFKGKTPQWRKKNNDFTKGTKSLGRYFYNFLNNLALVYEKAHVAPLSDYCVNAEN